MSNGNEILPDLLLKFEIEHPDIDDLYLEGYQAGLKNLSESINPYPKDSDNHHYWNEGWWDAFFEEAPVFMPLTEYSHAGVVADTAIHCANDESLIDENKESLFSLLFQVITLLFIGGLSYTIYDFAT